MCDVKFIRQTTVCSFNWFYDNLGLSISPEGIIERHQTQCQQCRHCVMGNGNSQLKEGDSNYGSLQEVDYQNNQRQKQKQSLRSKKVKMLQLMK